MKVNKAKIIDLMCAKDLTQEQLAKGRGVRNCTITAVLRGQRKPSIKTINKIAMYLGCNPSEIVELP